VAIIGAGIAGLCAGVYARKAGFDVEILEMNSAAGGLATSWTRQGYTFENCLHWLAGSNPTSTTHALWQEVLDIDRLTFVDHDEFARFESEDGRVVSLPTNVDRLEQELLAFAPEDAVAIRRFVLGVRRLRGLPMPEAAEGWLARAIESAKAVPYLPELRHWAKLTVADWSAQFRNPLLRRVFQNDESPEFSALGVVASMAWACGRDAGYAIGGSQAVIRGIEERFRGLGGRIRFGARVDRVLVRDDRATGVHLSTGEEVAADWVISAADGHSTLFDWIPSQYRDAVAERPYDTLRPFPSYVLVGLGINRDLRGEPASFVRVLDAPLELEPGSAMRQIAFRVFHFDPTFAPSGKTSVTAFMPTRNASYWTELQRANPAAYSARKADVADAVVAVLERRIPGIRAAVEVVDVSTPASVIRHTGNWQGSMEGFVISPAAGFGHLRQSLPGLENFLMVGQWVMPGGGLPSGVLTARHAVHAMGRAGREVALMY
jgi:phytoene dehydrogenase-like protein